MSGQDWADEPPGGGSFLDRLLAGSGAAAWSAAGDDELGGDDEAAVLDADAVRPYFLTGGRTTTEVDLGFEAMLTTVEGWRPDGSDAAELEAILTLAQEPVAVAEVSARLGLPIGVALVLAGDLVQAGLLEKSETADEADDKVDLIRRVISGVRALRATAAVAGT
ncbi:MAG: DUF742 domain-containing protein [Acidimicrobiales bacterium]